MRPTARKCPYCGLNVNLYYWDQHMRDSGDTKSIMGCPVLYLKRKSQ